MLPFLRRLMPFMAFVSASARLHRGEATKNCRRMKKLRSHTVGVDSGDVTLFKDFEDGGDMWTGQGQRERRRHIRFAESYKSPPTVQLSPSLWDLDTSTIMRADLAAENVSRTGFDMVFRTWGDTRVARMRIAWMAIGEMSELDDWDVS